jgi:ATP-dependent helicase HepA
LQSPPLPTVSLDENASTPLNFLDHGDPLHEALVREWAKIGRAAPPHLKVKLPEGHVLATSEAYGTYLVAVLSWVPGNRHFASLDRDPLIKRLQEAPTRGEQKPYWDAIQMMEEDLRADRRWLNTLFTARLDVVGAKLTGTQWALVEQDVADALFTPWDLSARGSDIVLAQGTRAAIATEIKATLNVGSKLLLREAAERHQRSLGECQDLRQRIASRRYLIASEAEDLIKSKQVALDDASAQGMETSERGFARSRFRAIRNARDIAIHSRDERLARLYRLGDEITKPSHDEYKYLLITIE